jgi:hypothetical protein
MRRLAALLVVLLVSLSRFGATAPSSTQARVVGRVLHELATPAVRLPSLVTRDVGARGPAHSLTPWLPSKATDANRVVVLSARTGREAPDVARTALGDWRAFTYDATAPPPLS